MALNKGRCRWCSKAVKAYVTCFECDSLYHARCLSKVPGLFVNEGGAIFCCSDTTSKSDDGTPEVAAKDITLSTKTDCVEHCLKTEQPTEEGSIIKEENTIDCGLKAGEEVPVYFEMSSTMDLESDAVQLSEQAVDGHEQNELSNSRESLVCTFCKEQLQDVKDYESHVKICKSLNEQRNAANENDDKLSFSPIKRKVTVRRYKCSYCPYAAVHEIILKRHISQLHRDEEQKYKCLNCKFLTNDEACYASHIRIHLGKPFKCPHEKCDYACKRYSYLQRHKLIKHSDEDKLKIKCHYCSYKTRHKSDLTVHLRIHSRFHITPKLFSCSNQDCNFKCDSLRQLEEHVRTHIDKLKKYKCPKCEYLAHTKSDLIGHIRTHATKTFCCPHKNCNFKAVSTYSLNKHIKIHHDFASIWNSYRTVES